MQEQSNHPSHFSDNLNTNKKGRDLEKGQTKPYLIEDSEQEREPSVDTLAPNTITKNIPTSDNKQAQYKQLDDDYKSPYYGATSLHLAVMNNHIEHIKFLVNKDANVNAQDDYGNTPLHIAVKNRKEDVMELLCKNDEGVNIKNKQGNTPLHTAIGNKDEKSVKILLEHGADVTKKDKDGNTSFQLAINSWHSSIIQLLLKSGKNIEVNIKDKQGNSPLHIAIINSDEQSVNLLLSIENIVLNSRDQLNYTPLHRAVINHMRSIVALLIEKGASVNTKGRDGKTPLHCASESHNLILLKLFLDSNKTALNAQDQHGNTSLHIIAGKKDNVEAMTLLLGNGAALNIKNKYGYTPLHLVVKNKDTKAARLLLKNGANVNQQDHQGQTPLHIAIKNNDQEMLEMLLNNKADVNAQIHYYRYDEAPLSLAANPWNPMMIKSLLTLGKNIKVNIRDKEEKTPLHKAVENKNVEITQLLLEKGAEMDAKDSEGKTPLCIAIENDNKPIITIFSNVKNEGSTHPLTLIDYLSRWCRPLLSLKKKVNASIQASIQEKIDGTLLHSTISNMNLNGVKLALDKSTDVNQKDKGGNSPLHLAVRNNTEEIVKLLLEHGANVNAKDKDGNTPLHWASNKKIAKLLLEKGADINAKDKDSYTPLHSSIENKKKEVTIFLLENGNNKHTQDQATNRSIVRMGSHLWDFCMIKLGVYRMHKMVYHYSSSSRIFYLAHRCIAKTILQPEKTDINTIGRSGNTPLHLAIITLNQEAIKHLLEKGADINAQNNDGHTPLSLAVDRRYRNSDVLKNILSLGKNVDKSLRNSEMESVLLHWTVSSHDLDSVRLLLEKGANMSVQDQDGYIPLYWAVVNNEHTIASLLLEKEVDINEKDYNTLLKLAIGNPEMEKLLQQHKKTSTTSADAVVLEIA